MVTDALVMLKTLLPILLLSFMAPTAALAQKTFSDPTWGFSIRAPNGWQAIHKSDVEENLAKTELPETSRQRILADKNLVFVVGYQRSESTQSGRLIPAIQVGVVRKGPSTFTSFKEQIQNSEALFSQTLSDFKVVEFAEVEVSGLRAVGATFTFTVTRASGLSLRARTHAYFVPLRDYYFQIFFNDGPDPDADCSSEFDMLLKTI